MDGNLAIRLESIHKQYGTKVAVDDFDLAVPRATICGLLGPNGAGKTTTIRVMLDIIGTDETIQQVYHLSLTTADFELSLEAKPGEVVVLLGRNGAGTSTTLKTVMGLLRARAGAKLAIDPHQGLLPDSG